MKLDSSLNNSSACLLYPSQSFPLSGINLYSDWNGIINNIPTSKTKIIKVFLFSPIFLARKRINIIEIRFNMSEASTLVSVTQMQTIDIKRVIANKENSPVKLLLERPRIELGIMQPFVNNSQKSNRTFKSKHPINASNYFSARVQIVFQKPIIFY